MVFTLKAIAYCSGVRGITKVRRGEWIVRAQSLPGKCYPCLPGAEGEVPRAVTSLSCLELGSYS